ncbi:MAG: glycosyltransferase family 4 protein [Pedobacter sp.]
MKKICFFISSVELAGGTERVCSAIANKLAELGWQVSVLSMYGDVSFFPLRSEIQVACVFQKKQSSKFLPYTVFKIRGLLTTLNPEILVSVDSAMFVYAFVSSWWLGIKHLVWEHFNFHVSLGSRIRTIARKLAAKYSAIIVTLTVGDKEEWKTNLKCKSKLVTIANPSPFTPMSVELINRKPVVLAVGRITYQKGFDRLLNAWKTVTLQIDTNWKLHIVGSGEDEQLLSEKVEALGIAASVRLIPRTANIKSHYMESSIFCLSSRFEGFPMVLLEAQSFGLPLVSYNCKTGPAEIINDGNGILIEDGNEQLMADALIKLMGDRELRTEMGSRSLRNSHKFDINVIVGQWTALLNTM